MENIETSGDSRQINEEERRGTQREGVTLEKILDRSDAEIDNATREVLRLILEQYNFLSHVEVVFISPEEEPNTGGFFHRVQIDEQTFIPTIFIVSENEKHIQRLMDVREASAKRVANMLNIKFTAMTPGLLRKFIIAHELGHAADYVKNYETNPDYNGADAAEEWALHYEANLFTMPVPGFDPVDLREEISKFNDLEAFLAKHTNVTINTGEINTLQDLLTYQEEEYRTSLFESYADKFATDFLVQNASDLGIMELQKFEEAT